MSDIEERLREHADYQQFRYMTVSDVLRRGADEVERLQARVAELEAEVERVTAERDEARAALCQLRRAAWAARSYLSWLSRHGDEEADVRAMNLDTALEGDDG